MACKHIIAESHSGHTSVLLVFGVAGVGRGGGGGGGRGREGGGRGGRRGEGREKETLKLRLKLSCHSD